MKKAIMLLALLYSYSFIYAQKDTLEEKTLDEAVVYSNKFTEKRKFIVQNIDIVSSRTIAKYNSQNTGDLLINTGKVFVQKSQQGGSSPVIRGFEASRVLIVIDGIRHNTAIFRAGHLQNVITVDQNMLEQMEVMYGPSSTLYGSDALGGTVYLRTKSPKLSTTDKALVTGSAFTRLSSANNEKTVHYDLSIGSKKVAWLSAFTFSDFGDMTMGSKYLDKYPTFGRRDSVIEFFGFKDSVIANKNPQVQNFSGYKQWDVMQKLLFQQNDKIAHTLNFQYSNTNDVPRYDRFQDTRNFGGSIGTTLRWAEWFYGPQKRILGAYELGIKSTGLFDNIRANINYQDLEESRQQREYLRYDRFDSRREHVKVWGFVIDGKKDFNNNELTVGIDGQFNDVTSVADRTNLTTGKVTKLDTRYPDGKNKMNYFGIYAQHLLKSKDRKFILNDGIRFQTTSLHSTVLDNSFFNLHVTNFEQKNFAVTGNLGVVYNPQATTRVTLGLSSGFRTPNIDDLVKVFDFSVAKRVFVPNADIKPEYTYNIDLGVRQMIADRGYFEVSGFYTLFKNIITPAPFTLNGQDSIMYNGVKSAVFANQNMDKARTYGFNVNAKYNITNQWSLFSTATYTKGKIIRYDGSEIPQDHIPPFFGKTSLNYQQQKFGLELYGMYNGWKRISDYNPDGEDNQKYATPDGMPSWFTLNWRGNVSLGKTVQVQLAVENIFDRNYRYFASGFSAPGRNFIIALRTNF